MRDINDIECDFNTLINDDVKSFSKTTKLLDLIQEIAVIKDITNLNEEESILLQKMIKYLNIWKEESSIKYYEKKINFLKDMKDIQEGYLELLLEATGEEKVKILKELKDIHDKYGDMNFSIEKFYQEIDKSKLELFKIETETK